MEAGLVLDWSRLEVGVTGSFTKSLSGAHGSTTLNGGAVSRTYFADNLADWDPGIVATVSWEHDVTLGTDTVTYEMSVPALGISDSTTASGTSGSSLIRFVDFKVYVKSDQTWLATWSDIEWYVDGGLQSSFGSGSLVSPYLTPAGVPLFGLPAEVSALAYMDPSPVAGAVIDADITSDVQAQAVGGWRFYNGTAYVSPSVNVLLPSVGSHGGSCACDPTAPSLSGDDSFSLTANAREQLVSVKGSVTRYVCETCPPGGVSLGDAETDVHESTTVYEKNSSHIVGIPDLPKSIERLGGADSYALWFRLGLPATYAQWSSACETEVGGGGAGSSSASGLVARHPRRSSVLSAVGEAVHALETTFSDATYAPAGWNAEKWSATESFLVTVVEPGCDMPGPGPPEPHEQCWDDAAAFCQVIQSVSFPAVVESYPTVADMAPVFSHAHERARYANTVAAPHWSILLWFPPDETGVTKSYEWTVDGARANPSDYWLPVRTQYCKHPSLPSSENVLRRTSIVAEPLMSGALDGWVESNLLGQLSSWVGVSRFQPMSYALPSTYTYGSGSSGLWSATDCVLTHGASVTVNPDAGKYDVSFDLDLASFTTEPYLFPQVAHKIKAEWTTTNVSSMSVYLVNPHGDKVLLTSSTPAGALLRPQGEDTKYAGSWGQDFGNGAVSDTGTDQTAAGESATVCASDERAPAFQLLRGWGAAKLRYELTVDDPDVDVTVSYPVLYAPTDYARTLAENGNWHCMVWDSGPGVRFGQWSWHDGTSLLSSPTVLPIGWPYPVGWFSSVLDALVWKRVVLQAEAHDDGLDAEVQSIYDSVENAGTTADERYLSADTFTNVFWIEYGKSLAGTCALVNSLSEVPPAANLPVYDRDTGTLSSKSTLVQKTWTYSKRPRDIVLPSGTLLELVDPDTGQNWVTQSEIVPGWSRARHDRQVDNYEGPNFEVTVDGADYAHASPWHGYFAVLPATDQAGENPWCFHERHDHYHRASTDSGNVWYRQVARGFPVPGFDIVAQVTSSGDDSHPRMAVDPLTQRMHLVFVREDPASTFVLYLATSDDDGKTWSTPVATITDGRYPTVACSIDGTVVIAAFKYLSGSSGPGKVYTSVRKLGDTAFSTPTAVTDGSSDIEFAEDTFHVSQAFDGPHTWVLAARPSGSSDVREYRSYDDCATFEVI